MKKLIFFTMLIGIISCNQEALSPAIDCLGEVDDSVPVECPSDIEGDKFCEVNYVGKFGLTDKSKSYLPVYCESIGQSIVYTNGVGDNQVFTIKSKNYITSNALVTQDRICESDSSKTSIDCIENEKAYVIIESPQNTLELSITTLPDTKDPISGGVGDFFQIKREEVPGFYVEEWISVIDQRSMSYAMESCTELYPAIELNGIIYHDVTGFEEEGECAHFMYYINQEYGLVGFSRSDGVLWSIAQ